ncbi:TFPI [Mytilus coruscus]|uniref:TFPI n=1 Tax=Mytilus coruscus TaxID=42192 RepID=A0A6J8ETV2_MYTCO|nr:TFPI [Mytilus coruscus]
MKGYSVLLFCFCLIVVSVQAEIPLFEGLPESTTMCQLSADRGPCKARMERYYYNQKDRQCKTFPVRITVHNAMNPRKIAYPIELQIYILCNNSFVAVVPMFEPFESMVPKQCPCCNLCFVCDICEDNGNIPKACSAGTDFRTRGEKYKGESKE